MADGKSENSWRQCYPLSWLVCGCVAGECVSHKHWQPHRHGNRRRRVSYTGSSAVALLNRREENHSEAAEENNCECEFHKTGRNTDPSFYGEKGKGALKSRQLVAVALIAEERFDFLSDRGTNLESSSMKNMEIKPEN